VQAVQMTAMRHPLALLPGRWQRIPLDHRYLLVDLGQDPRGQQPSQARAENDRVIRGLAHPRSLPSRYAPCGARLSAGVSNLSRFEPPAQLGACCSDNRDPDEDPPTSQMGVVCVSLGGSLRSAVRKTRPIHSPQTRDYPVLVTSSEDQATCNQTPTPC
jgi:hypothetical protein